MHKEEAFYNSNGEKVFSRTTRFTGRFHEEKGYSLYAHGKSICSRTIDFPPGMNKTDIANMVLLSKHLLPETNVLGYRNSKGKQPMALDRIAVTIQTGERQTQRFIKKMMDLGLMKRNGQEYVVNPLYFLNGKMISDSLYWLFQEELDLHLTAWVRDTYRKRKEGG